MTLDPCYGVTLPALFTYLLSFLLNSIIITAKIFMIFMYRPNKDGTVDIKIIYRSKFHPNPYNKHTKYKRFKSVNML